MKINIRNIVICWTVFVCVCVLVGISGIVYLVCNAENIVDYCTSWHSTNQKALIEFLEENYNVHFPQSMTDIQAAELYTGIDGSLDFILKFRADAGQTNDFLHQLCRDPNRIEPYTIEFSKKAGDEYPKWFKSPMIRGLKGHVTSKSNTGLMMDIYVDTGNENYSVVYMEGIYKM